MVVDLVGNIWPTEMSMREVFELGEDDLSDEDSFNQRGDPHLEVKQQLAEAAFDLFYVAAYKNERI